MIKLTSSREAIGWRVLNVFTFSSPPENEQNSYMKEGCANWKENACMITKTEIITEWISLSIFIFKMGSAYMTVVYWLVFDPKANLISPTNSLTLLVTKECSTEKELLMIWENGQRSIKELEYIPELFSLIMWRGQLPKQPISLCNKRWDVNFFISLPCPMTNISTHCFIHGTLNLRFHWS